MTNASWNFYLRRQLQNWALISLLLYLSVLMGLAASLDLSFRTAMFKVLLPGSPFALMLLTLCVDSRVAVPNLQSLKNSSEHALRAGAGSASDAVILANQERLFKHRQMAFPLPNVIHHLLKRRTEAQVGECLNALSSTPP